MLKIKNRRAREPAEINLASTADIAFLLIVFFLAASALLEFHGVKVPLPVKDAPPMELLKENLFKIQVNARSEIIHQNKTISKEELLRLLKERFSTNKEIVAVLKMNPEAKSELLPELIRSIEQTGIAKISIGMGL